VAVVVVVGVREVDATDLAQKPGFLRAIGEAPRAVVLEEAKLIAQSPGRSDDVLVAVAIEVFDDAAPGESDRIDPCVHRDVWKSLDVVLRSEHIRGDQPLRWHLLGVLANRHVGQVQQPGDAQMFGLCRQAFGEGVDGAPRAALQAVHTRGVDGEETRGRAMVEDAVLLLAEPEGRDADGALQPDRLLGFLACGDA